MQRHKSIPVLGSTITINEVDWIICGYKMLDDKPESVGVVLASQPLGLTNTESLQIVPLDSIDRNWQEEYLPPEAKEFTEELEDFYFGKEDSTGLAKYFDYDVKRTVYTDSVGCSQHILPVGSIVSLSISNQKHMVIGYYPIHHGIIYDYLVTPYPQGMFEFPLIGMIVHNDIEAVIHQPRISADNQEFLESLQEIADIRKETNMKITETINRYQTNHPEEANQNSASDEQIINGYNLE